MRIVKRLWTRSCFAIVIVLVVPFLEVLLGDDESVSNSARFDQSELIKGVRTHPRISSTPA
ncbi:hypothetical protein Z949_849 [Sulfitobacter guttiformis KCTC 32187]|nr:hypothetical protein Z949_849 [Sulfitobacter guttiformis KCTC 32187]